MVDICRVSKRAKPLPALGDLELAALEHLWNAGESDVATTHAAIGRRRGISLNTVGSALERLYKKGLIARKKVSHAFQYHAVVSQDELTARRVMDAAGGVEALAGAGLLAAFVDLVAEADEAALLRLERLVAQKRGQGDS